MGRKPKQQTEFYGVWGRMRAEFLQRERPAVYSRLVESGELMSYLEGYQRVFSQRADELHRQFSQERGLNNALMKRNPLRWILLAGQIHLEILRQLEAEIKQ